MTSFENIHALIIEDDRVSIDVLQSLLLHVGVTHTSISRDIQQQINEIPVPDVVFLDLEMPGLNGYEVLQILRTHEAYQNVPIVAYTTHTSHLNTAHDAGFNAFLGKPINRHDFADNLARILQGESVWEIP